MIYTVSFVVVLAALMIDSSQAVTCYNCSYTRSSGSLSNNCGGIPTFQPGSQRECSGSFCSWQLSNYTNPTSK